MIFSAKDTIKAASILCKLIIEMLESADDNLSEFINSEFDETSNTEF